MGVHVLVVYVPVAGRESELDLELAGHAPLLRRLGLATDAPSTVLRAPDGTIVEQFEWRSREALASAHEHPEVLQMWERFESCCTYGSLADLPHATSLFPEFDLVGVY